MLRNLKSDLRKNVSEFESKKKNMKIKNRFFLCSKILEKLNLA